MAKKRRGPKCKDCCAPECSIQVNISWRAGVGYFWAVGVMYKRVATAGATLVASGDTPYTYSGSAFTYPAFNGVIEIPFTNSCQYKKFTLAVTGKNGAYKECVWVNPNCCCDQVFGPGCTEYRVPMSRGVNMPQPGVLATLAGVADFPGFGCAVASFFNGSYFMPFGGGFSKTASVTCAWSDGRPYVVSLALSLGWGRNLCPTTSAYPPDPVEYCTDYPTIQTVSFQYGLQAVGSANIVGGYGAGSRFTLLSPTYINAVEDYTYDNCNLDRAECYEIMQRKSCANWFGQATKTPPTVYCANFQSYTGQGCCGFPGPCPTCASQCGGPADFRGCSLSGVLV